MLHVKRYICFPMQVFNLYYLLVKVCVCCTVTHPAIKVAKSGGKGQLLSNFVYKFRAIHRPYVQTVSMTQKWKKLLKYGTMAAFSFSKRRVGKFTVRCKPRNWACFGQPIRIKVFHKNRNWRKFFVGWTRGTIEMLGVNFNPTMFDHCMTHS